MAKLAIAASNTKKLACAILLTCHPQRSRDSEPREPWITEETHDKHSEQVVQHSTES